mmetsp:Transcript_85680/g.239423  ORF Transcript_85680/g.239423 Transcript_85680/m.239423 type:complete len:521 (-) Transcript_85680:264-1826(-)
MDRHIPFRKIGTDANMPAQKHPCHNVVPTLGLPVSRLFQPQEELGVERHDVGVVRQNGAHEMWLGVPTSMGLQAPQSKSSRRPANVKVAEVAQHVLPFYPEATVVFRPRSPRELRLQVRAVGRPVNYGRDLLPRGIARREATTPSYAAPRVFQVQQPMAAKPPAIDHWIRVPRNKPSGRAHALNVAEAPRLRVWLCVCELRRADANDAMAIAETIARDVENLVPLRGAATLLSVLPISLQVRATAEGDRIRDPAGEVEHIGTRVRTLHVVGTAHDFRERLLQQRHPYLVGVSRVRAKELAVGSHRHAVIDYNLALRSIQKKAAAVLAVLVINWALGAVEPSPRVQDAAEDWLSEPRLVFRQRRHRGEKRTIAHESLLDGTRSHPRRQDSRRRRVGRPDDLWQPSPRVQRLALPLRELEQTIRILEDSAFAALPLSEEPEIAGHVFIRLVPRRYVQALQRRALGQNAGSGPRSALTTPSKGHASARCGGNGVLAQCGRTLRGLRCRVVRTARCLGVRQRRL